MLATASATVATAKTIAVTANGAPVITVPGAQTLGINQLTAITGVSVAEAGGDGQRDVYGDGDATALGC